VWRSDFTVAGTANVFNTDFPLSNKLLFTKQLSISSYLTKNKKNWIIAKIGCQTEKNTVKNIFEVFLNYLNYT
jgi:hypothetical protein